MQGRRRTIENVAKIWPRGRSRGQKVRVEAVTESEILRVGQRSVNLAGFYTLTAKCKAVESQTGHRQRKFMARPTSVAEDVYRNVYIVLKRGTRYRIRAHFLYRSPVYTDAKSARKSARIYGPYIRVSFWTPAYTGRIYGRYIRVVCIRLN